MMSNTTNAYYSQQELYNKTQEYYTILKDNLANLIINQIKSDDYQTALIETAKKGLFQLQFKETINNYINVSATTVSKGYLTAKEVSEIVKQAWSTIDPNFIITIDKIDCGVLYYTVNWSNK